MAIKVGQRKDTCGGLSFSQPVPYIAYDEDDEFPIGPEVDGLGIKVRTAPTDELRPLYPDALFELSEEEDLAYDAEVATVPGNHPEAKRKRLEIRERYTRPYVERCVEIIRQELQRLDSAWQSL